MRNIAFLVDDAHLLDMPIQCTEQYPRGLDAMVPELVGKPAAYERRIGKQDRP